MDSSVVGNLALGGDQDYFQENVLPEPEMWIPPFFQSFGFGRKRSWNFNKNKGPRRSKAGKKKLPSPKPKKPSDKRVLKNISNLLKLKAGTDSMEEQMREPVEEEESGDEDMGVAETYSDYMPSKLKVGKKHPDPVVETASLSSVQPPDIEYELALPESVTESGSLSALQLEAITYAAQQHEHFLPDGCRAGFLIGDGAGVGKGRTVAGCIYENYLKGRRKALWISVSNDLKYDSERDLRDIGAQRIRVYALNKFKYDKISSAANGRVVEGVIFSTYSALLGTTGAAGAKIKSRKAQLLEWCGDDFDGVIIFDECHKAKNLIPVGKAKPSKTAVAVVELQTLLPAARVVYASATGASEPHNMAYMTRLGMWGKGTPFPDFKDLIKSVEKRGVGAMEIVAMDMKLRGIYMARQLSFHGVTFNIEEIPLTPEFVRVYDDSVALWVDMLVDFENAIELMDVPQNTKRKIWGQFWSAHQRFFKYLCIAAKVQRAVEIAREAVKLGKCAVIGLQSTGEAVTLESLKEDNELNDFVSTAKSVLQHLVEKHFPAPDKNKIFHLLGIKNPENLLKDETGRSGRKKKPVRKAAIHTTKKAKVEPLSSESSSGVSDSDSHFSPSDSESNSDSSTVFSISSDNSDDDNSNSDSKDQELKGLQNKPNKKRVPKKQKNTRKASLNFGSDVDSEDEELPHMVSGNNQKSHNKPNKKRLPKKRKASALFDTEVDSAEEFPHMVSGNNQTATNKACAMRQGLLEKIEQLGKRLPPNTLDQLIDELGGPENVAEMTGRKGRVVQMEGGNIGYESRSEAECTLETLNLTEKKRFMDGEKFIAIISEAASSGISLQSDRRALNQRRRVHITLELPWSADRAVQQFGRTHRSNQVNAPEYIFLISNLAGERRFASIVAKRLESLGALTHGDRRATETRDLSRFNIDNKYGHTALDSVMKAVMGLDGPLVPPPQEYKGDFFKDVTDALVGVGMISRNGNSLEKEHNSISRFLNRILGVPVELQNQFFQYFTDTLHAIINQAKKSGRYDLGILDLGTAGENVHQVRLHTCLRQHATGSAITELHVVEAERGVSWEQAVNISDELSGPKEGFYLSYQIRNGKHTAILAVCPSNKITGSKYQFYTIYRPNTGLQLKQETLGDLEKKYRKVKTCDAKKHWEQQYKSAETTCSHAYWSGRCKNKILGLGCEVGLRRRTYNVLAGSVLSVWAKVEAILESETRMQVVRLRTSEGSKIVGTLIPKSCVEDLLEALKEDASNTIEKIF